MAGKDKTWQAKKRTLALASKWPDALPTYASVDIGFSSPVAVLQKRVQDTPNSERRFDDIGSEFPDCEDEMYQQSPGRRSGSEGPTVFSDRLFLDLDQVRRDHVLCALGCHGSLSIVSCRQGVISMM
jgi:hypothetical protein